MSFSPSRSLQFLFFNLWASSIITQLQWIFFSSGQSARIISNVVMTTWNLKTPERGFPWVWHRSKQSFTLGLLNSTRSSEKTAQFSGRWEANMPCFLSYEEGENLRMNYLEKRRPQNITESNFKSVSSRRGERWRAIRELFVSESWLLRRLFMHYLQPRVYLSQTYLQRSRKPSATFQIYFILPYHSVLAQLKEQCAHSCYKCC